MVLVTKLHFHRIFRCTDPSKLGIDLTAPAKLFNKAFLESLVKLVKDGVKAVVSCKRLGRETGGVHFQGLHLGFEPSQVPHAVVHQIRPVPIPVLIRPCGLWNNSSRTDQFVSKPCYMDIQTDVFPIFCNGFFGQFHCSFHKMIQSFPPHHLVNELCHIGWLPLLKMLRQVVLLE